MRMLCIFLGCLAIGSLSGCSSSESYSRQGYDFYQIDKVAVVDVVGLVGSEAAKNQIADFFAMELLKKGYSPIGRSQVQVLLKEQEFQTSDITSGKDIAKAGQILNVPVIMIVNVPKFDTDITLTVKMLDVKDGSILWMGSAEGSAGETLGTVFGAVTDAIVSVIATGQDDPVADDVTEEVAENLLSPDQEKLIRELVRNVCNSLPNRR